MKIFVKMFSTSSTHINLVWSGNWLTFITHWQKYTLEFVRTYMHRSKLQELLILPQSVVFYLCSISVLNTYCKNKHILQLSCLLFHCLGWSKKGKNFMKNNLITGCESNEHSRLADPLKLWMITDVLKRKKTPFKVFNPKNWTKMVENVESYFWILMGVVKATFHLKLLFLCCL